MKKALVAGSFDPITLGHLFVIEKALEIADVVQICLAVNPTKIPFFTVVEREQMIKDSVFQCIPSWDHSRVEVKVFKAKSFIASHAHTSGCAFIVRGIRNTLDFEYENEQQAINTMIAPDLPTVFVIPPAELIKVRSSTIKQMVGIDGWEPIVQEFVPKNVFERLKMKSKTNVAQCPGTQI